MTPIVNFLSKDVLPEDKVDAKRIRRHTALYTFVNGELFRRGFSAPLLKCLELTQADYMLAELHKGICEVHSGARTMAMRVLRAGYYWPTIKQDTRTYTDKCPECQRFEPVFNAPPEELHQTVTPWPFSRSGVDILGPFPLAKG